jgi:hypothetical protein
MRQIDNMTSAEIDVLKLKGMLPDRTTQKPGREMLQDDGKRKYTCSPTWCGYDGDKTCQNCGFSKDENYPLERQEPRDV